jgi:hypothetical protein
MIARKVQELCGPDGIVADVQGDHRITGQV